MGGQWLHYQIEVYGLELEDKHVRGTLLLQADEFI